MDTTHDQNDQNDRNEQNEQNEKDEQKEQNERKAKIAIEAELASHPPRGTFVSCPIHQSRGGACRGDLIHVSDREVHHLSERAFEREMEDPIDRPRFGGHSVIWKITDDRYEKSHEKSLGKTHMFDLICHWSRWKKIPIGWHHTAYARHIYRFGWWRAEWSDEDGRDDVLFEKHYRAAPARALFERERDQLHACMTPSPGFVADISDMSFHPGDTIRFAEVESKRWWYLIPGRREIEALVLRESRGIKTGRITCTLKILRCDAFGNIEPLEANATIRRMKDKIVRYGAFSQETNASTRHTESAIS